MLQKFRTYSVKISKEAQIIWPSGKQAWMHRYIYVLSIPVQRGNTVAQKIGNSRFSWGQFLISRVVSMGRRNTFLKFTRRSLKT
jgi:hypothetical protein